MVKIIFIGGEKHLINTYVSQLTQANFQVKVAKSGIAGLKMLHDEKFALVLLDIMLPEMHGLELLKKLRTTKPYFETPIVILSDNTEDDIIKESFSLGIKGYLVKMHYTPAQIVDYIKKMC